MNEWVLGVDQAASVWWTYVFHATWQGALVGLLVLAAVYLGKRLPAPLRYWLLLVALAKFLFPPFLSLPVGVFHFAGPVVPATPPAISIAMPVVPERSITVQPPMTLESSVTLEPSVSFEPSIPLQADLSSAPAPEDPNDDLVTSQIETPAPSQPALILPGWRTWLLAAHAVGFLLLVAWIVMQWILLMKATRRAQRVTEGDLYERFLSLCRQIGLQRRIRLLISAEQQAPMAFGLFYPTVMVPKSVAEDLTPAQADTILTHELAHHRRGDIWVNWTQLVLIAVWWFNPVVWLLSRALRRTREDCCDDLVLSRKLTTPDAYCETLLRAAAELSAPMPLGAVLGFAERVHPLANRLCRIMDGTIRRSARLSFVGLLAVVAVAIFLLPGLPSAQREEEKAEKATMENEAVGDHVILSSEIVPNSPLRGPSGESIYGLGNLQSVAYSPDGKSIATCGSLGAFLWDVETNRPVRAFYGHTEPVYGVRFSPDGTRILTVGGDIVRLWDVKTGNSIRSFGGHEKAIACAVFSPDGRRIVTAGGDGLAKVWDAETGAEIRTLSGHKAGVFSVAFSPDGKKVLTGSEDNTAKMWDAETGSEIHTLAGHKLLSHTRNVISVAFSPDGTKVLTRGGDGTAKIWDAGKGLEIRTYGSDFEEDMRVGFFVEFSPDGKMILSAASGARAALWDTESGAQIRKFGNPGSQSSSAVFSPDGTKVLAVNENMDVDLWDVETGGKIQTFTGHTSRVDCAALSPDGTKIVTSNGILWDVNTGKEEVRIFPPERFRGIGGSAAAFSRDGKKVLIGRKSVIWNVAIGGEFPERPSRQFEGNYLGLSPDGMPIITDGFMIELIKETGEMERFSGHTGDVLSVAFSSDGTKLLTGSRDKTARLWDVGTGSQIRAFQGHEDSVDAVALSPDGTKVLTGSQDKTARLWDAETGQEIERFERHTRGVSTVAFSPDGTAYLTGSTDGTVLLMRPGREPASFPHSGMVSSVAFSPDGTKILTTSLDGTTRIWDLGDSAQVSAATPEVESATAGNSEPETEKGVAESETIRSHGTPSSNVVAFSSLRGPSGESIFGLGELLSAVYSPDGKYIATCGGLGAFLWDVQSNRLIRAFLGHTQEVYSVDFSPDGTKIVTGSDDKTARIWDTETGDLIRTFAGHTKGVRAAVFSPDGKRVVTGSWDTAKLWDSETGVEIRTLSGPESGVSDVAFSPDGKKILAGGTDNTARIWDAETGSEIRTFTGHGDQVRSVAFSPDGTKVLTGSRDQAAKIWDAETGSEIRTFVGHTKDVYSVAISPDGKKILTGGRGNMPTLWDADSGTQIRTFGEPGSTAISVAFSPDGTRVLAAGGDMNAHVWNMETGDEIQTFMGHTLPLFSTSLSPDGTKIVTSSGMLWDLTTGKAVQTFSRGEMPDGRFAAFLPDGLKVLMGSTHAVVLRDVETGTEIRRLKKITFTENIMALSPDGRRILTGSHWTAKLWDVETGEEIRTFSGHTAGVWSLGFSPDGTKVLTGARDNTARLWDVETGAQIQAFFGHDGAVRSVALSPDQKRVLTGSEDNTAKLWNAETGAQIRTLSGHTGNVSAVAFSPDGTECLTGSWDGTVKLWRRELVKTFVHNGAVSSVAYLPDRTRILTGSRDGTVRIWHLGELAQVSAAAPEVESATAGSPLPGLPNAERGGEKETAE